MNEHQSFREKNGTKTLLATQTKHRTKNEKDDQFYRREREQEEEEGKTEGIKHEVFIFFFPLAA